MVQVRTVEITVGAFIAAGMVALFFLAMQVSTLSTFSGGDGYHVTARFENIGGLKVRSAVTVNLPLPILTSGESRVCEL